MSTPGTTALHIYENDIREVLASDGVTMQRKAELLVSISELEKTRLDAARALVAANSADMESLQLLKEMVQPKTKFRTGPTEMTVGTMSGRNTHMINTVGSDLFDKIHKSRVLMVGAGGIGCELLKNLVMSGFADIEVVDLDTIDLSNLNRQFLFQRHHIKKSKAHVARESALAFNPNVNIKSYHESIYESQFDIAWFKSFDVVLNALDNLAARRHVNQMCLAAGVPLVESGTEGFVGQVTLHVKDSTACYDCEPKATRKTYPVCTIRSTPSAPIHCIVWAKSYLFSMLFGRIEDGGDIQNEQETSENAKELENIRREEEATKRLRKAVGSDDYGRMVFEKVFSDDIKKLLTMEDMWKHRRPPTPLNLEECTRDAPAIPANPGLEWDQKPWSLQENVQVFLQSVQELGKRLIEAQKSDPEYALAFDKDDEAALNFVTSTANLRAHIYGIEQKSRFDTKEMAGNIIPAIATTNAIIAGMIVVSAIKVLDGKWDECTNMYLKGGLHSEKLLPPNPECPVCSSRYLVLRLNTKTAKLKDVIEIVTEDPDGKGLSIPGDLTIENDGRGLYDPDFDDNLDRTLEDMKIHHGSRLTIQNEYDEEDSKVVTLVLSIEQEDSSANGDFELVGDKNIFAGRRRVVPKPAPEPVVHAQGTERKGEGVEGNGTGEGAKKPKVDDDPILIDDDGAVMVVD
ncbi:E1 ubiquitin-activating protein uba2 [Borealophlyctis nickersoniae]|nr:E1 ubiquitin-activating protein uba2 [Borealophlyctis nickersoniae]